MPILTPPLPTPPTSNSKFILLLSSTFLPGAASHSWHPVSRIQSTAHAVWGENLNQVDRCNNGGEYLELRQGEEVPLIDMQEERGVSLWTKERQNN